MPSSSRPLFIRLIGLLAVVLVSVSLAGAHAGAAAAAPDHGANPNETAHGDETVPGRVLVGFEPNADRAAIAARLGAHRESVGMTGVEALALPEQAADRAIEQLGRHPQVAYAERDRIVRTVAEPNDPLWSSQWGASAVQAPQAWETTTGDAEFVVAVLDTGIDPGHEDLADALVPGHNVLDDNDDTTDRHGHGTAAASVAAARGDNTRGLAGLCWTCGLMPVKVLADDGTGRVSDLAEGLTWAADHGADVAAMSLGGTQSTRTLETAVSHARSEGMVLVGAAGNAGTSERFYPAANDQVLGVAASDHSDGRYEWSNHGDWVEVAAPGCNPASRLDNSYTKAFCGTSSAAPLVAGTAALLLASDPGLTADDAHAAITDTAVDIGGWVAHGRIDTAAALAALPETTDDETTDDGTTDDGTTDDGTTDDGTTDDGTTTDDGDGSTTDDGGDATTVAACPDGEVPDAGFADITGNPHAPNIDCVAWHGLANGTGSDTFSPALAVRRDQMASFVTRLLEAAGVDLPDTSDGLLSGSLFDDLLGNLHAESIYQLAELDVVNGLTDSSYGPSESVRRDQMASFLVRAYEHVHGELPAPPSGFTDIEGNAHQTNIDKAAAAGFARGTDLNTYSPAQPVRRDQMASFLARTLERAAQDGHVTPPSS